MAGSSRAGFLGLLAATWFLVACGGGGDSSPSAGSDVPEITAPQVTLPTQPGSGSGVKGTGTSASTREGRSKTATAITPAENALARKTNRVVRPASPAETRAICESKASDQQPGLRAEALEECLNPPASGTQPTSKKP